MEKEFLVKNFKTITLFSLIRKHVIDQQWLIL